MRERLLTLVLALMLVLGVNVAAPSSAEAGYDHYHGYYCMYWSAHNRTYMTYVYHDHYTGGYYYKSYGTPCNNNY